MDYVEMIIANKADTCVRSVFKYASVNVCARASMQVYVVTERVQALSALPARL